MTFPYFELAASLFILLLAFQIWTRHYENPLARFFAQFALVAFGAAILEYSYRIAFTLEFARDLDRLATPLWAFVFPLFTHFALIFTKNEKWLESKGSLFLLYLPAAVISCLTVFTDMMFIRYEIWSIGIVSIPSAWYSLFLLNSLVFSAVPVYLLLRYAASTHQKSESFSARLIAAGVALPFLVGLVTDEAIPLVFGTRLTPPTAVFALAAMNLSIYLAMRYYSLFAISPALAADTIIEVMPDSLLVTDLDGRIIFINQDARKFFHASQQTVAGRCIGDLFKLRAKYDQLIDEVVGKKLEVERFQAEMIDPLGETIPALINANLLREKIVGETLGIVFVVRDIRG